MTEVSEECQQGFRDSVRSLALHCCALWVGIMLTCKGVISQPALTALLKQRLDPCHQFYSLNPLFTEIRSHNPVNREWRMPYQLYYTHIACEFTGKHWYLVMKYSAEEEVSAWLQMVPFCLFSVSVFFADLGLVSFMPQKNMSWVVMTLAFNPST